jgi:hypothetical protein
MEKEFCPYEIALALKELDFNKPCFGYYVETKKWIPASYSQKETIYPSNSDLMKEWVSAPTFSQAFHFFRNKYGLMHIINPYDFTAEINYLNKRVVNDVYGDFIPHDHLVDDEGKEIKHLSYEEAENACLLELINICKKK